MKKLIKILSSLELMIVLLLLLAFVCAIATFIENDFGPLGAKSFIYGTSWFEAILVFLTISVIVNIFYFKMYSKNKFTVMMIHVSLVFLLLGASLTRYMGYEGIMTIPENSMQNRMLSTDEYIQVKVKKNDEILKEVDYKVLMTSLSQTNLDENLTILNENLNIKFLKFIPNAEEKIIYHKDGKAIVNLIVTKFDGASNFELFDKGFIDTALAVFTLNKNVKSKKPIINFLTNKNIVYIKSNLEISYSSLKGEPLGSIKANTKEELKPYYLYSVAQTRFITPEFTALGKLGVISKTKEKINKNTNLHAIVLEINYKNQNKQITLLGKGGSSEGFKKTIDIGNIELELQWGSKIIELPFALLLNKFTLERYPGSNSASSFSSDIKVYDKDLDETLEYKIYMNNTLDHKGYRFFQSSYSKDQTATILSVNKDPGRIPTYIGYFLLFVGLILNLFSKHGRFQKLSQKKYTIDNVKSKYLSQVSILLCALFLFAQTPSYATKLENNNINKIFKIDKEHADKFSTLLVQDYQGRIKPFNSLAIEIINKLSKSTKILGLNENQILLSMLIYPKLWQEVKFIRIANKRLKTILKLSEDDKLVSFSDVFDKKGNYILQIYLEKANSKKDSTKNLFDKDVIKVDERLNIAYKVFTGGFLKFFPKINDSNYLWLDPVSLNTISDLSKAQRKEIRRLMNNYLMSLKDSINNSNYIKANKNLEKIRSYQELHGQRVIKSKIKIKSEILYNKLEIFKNLTMYYLFLGLFLLFFVFIKIFKPNTNLKNITKIVLLLFVIGFLLHSFGLALRWYIAEYAPWSNSYETMIFISWAVILSGMFFSKKSNLALCTTGILSGIILFVAHLSWLEPQITTLVPVLKSYWLTIHVSVITASYGFLALSALLGFITMILYSLINKKNENETFFSILTSIEESRRINEMSMFIGLVLLVIGNFIGGIWANESWGRYWGWDPKETWTLVSIIIYTAIIHLRYIKGLNNNFIFSFLSMISFSSIIMTYFGVNYYLTGMHSYGAGDPIPIPTFVPVSVIIMFIVLIFSFRNRKVI
ncbi:MAG: cytochrome c biogenesis protein CcsA [Arcobacter sp.]|nr:cytochrome c biogenesis protein CcsA [Arcobacter sp.]